MLEMVNLKQEQREKRKKEEGDLLQDQTTITDKFVLSGLPGARLVCAATRRPDVAMGLVTKLSSLSRWSALHSGGRMRF